MLTLKVDGIRSARYVGDHWSYMLFLLSISSYPFFVIGHVPNAAVLMRLKDPH